MLFKSGWLASRRNENPTIKINDLPAIEPKEELESATTDPATRIEFQPQHITAAAAEAQSDTMITT